MKKKRFLANIITLVFAISVMSFGIYAAYSANLTMTGTVGFIAHECEVEVLGTIANAIRSKDLNFAKVTDKKYTVSEDTWYDKFSELDANGDSTNTPVAIANQNVDWVFGDVYFDDIYTEADGAIQDVIITLQVTNKSVYPIVAEINVDEIVKPNGITLDAPESTDLAVNETKDIVMTVSLAQTQNQGSLEVTADSGIALDLSNCVVEFNKAGGQGSGGNQGGEVVTGIDVNNLPQTDAELVELFESNGYTTYGSAPQYQFSKDGVDYMIMTHDSEDDAKATLEQLGAMAGAQGLMCGVNKTVFWATNDPNIELETTKLQVPSSASYTQDENTLTVGAVENASGYIVNYYQSDVLVATEELIYTESILSCTNTLPEGLYDVKLIAVGDDVTYANSDESEVLTQIQVIEKYYYSTGYQSSGLFQGLTVEVTRDENKVIDSISIGDNKTTADLGMFFADSMDLVKTFEGNNIKFTWPDESGYYILINRDESLNVTGLKMYIDAPSGPSNTNLLLTGTISKDQQSNCTKITFTNDQDDSLFGYVLVANSGLVVNEFCSVTSPEMNARMVYNQDGYVAYMYCDAIDEEQGINMKNYAVSEYIYNEDKQLTNELMYFNGNTLVQEVIVEYNENDQVSKYTLNVNQTPVTQNYGTRIFTYEYDQDGNLTKETENSDMYDPYNSMGGKYNKVTTYSNNQKTSYIYELFNDDGSMIGKREATYEYNLGTDDPKDCKEIERVYNSENELTHIRKTQWDVSTGYGNSVDGGNIYIDYDSRVDNVLYGGYYEGNPYQIITGTYDETLLRQLTRTETNYNGDGIATYKYDYSWTYQDLENYTWIQIVTNLNNPERFNSKDVQTYENGLCVQSIRENYAGPTDNPYLQRCKYEYEYNTQGLKSKETYTVYKPIYDESAAEEISYYTITEFEYDENGKETKRTETRYSADGVKESSNMYFDYIYENGNKVGQSQYYYHFDQEGNVDSSYKSVTLETIQNGLMQQRKVTHYKLDGENEVLDYIYTVYFENGSVVSQTEEYYHSTGDLWYTRLYNNQTGTEIYTDANGNTLQSAPDSSERQ